MRVLFVTHYTALLGANRSMLQLILELREYGVESTVLLPESFDKTGLIEELQKNKIPYIEAAIRSIKHSSFWKVFPNYLYSIFLRNKIIKKIQDQSFDLVHSNSSIIDTGKIIASKLKAKHIWHLREFGDLDYNFKTPFGKWYQKIIYSGDNHFVAISKAIEKHYSRFIDPDRIHTIYNGVKIYNQKRVDDKEKKIINFCIVGLIHENKRQKDVLKALNELVNVRKIHDCHIYIIGGGDQVYLQGLLDYADKTNLSSYVTFMGQRNNVPDLLKSMDVGIMASSNEAFGRVTVEYMAAGLAVIASDTGANGEIITHNDTGFLYHINDIHKLADHMELCIKDREMVARVSKNGYEHVLNNFSSHKNSEKVHSLYIEILKGKASGYSNIESSCKES